MFVKNLNLGADPNIGDFTVCIFRGIVSVIIYLFLIYLISKMQSVFGGRI